MLPPATAQTCPQPAQSDALPTRLSPRRILPGHREALTDPREVDIRPTRAGVRPMSAVLASRRILPAPTSTAAGPMTTLPASVRTLPATVSCATRERTVLLASRRAVIRARSAAPGPMSTRRAPVAVVTGPGTMDRARSSAFLGTVPTCFSTASNETGAGIILPDTGPTFLDQGQTSTCPSSTFMGPASTVDDSVRAFPCPGSAAKVPGFVACGPRRTTVRSPQCRQ
jgi:hypothetical protein